ncbi:MAG TPA: nodulation protein NfeD [Anaerolineales bacterium]|nr:nodulation protein NfeD [Anaerolineales bacterium]
MRHWRWKLLTALTVLTLAASPPQTASPHVLLLRASGALTPAMAEYLERGLATADGQGAAAVVLMLDTPGGSIDLMNRMVQAIRASTTPVIVYVAPRGAIAGSAGTVISLAGHVLAMAPETAIGAASPVGPQGEDLGQTLEAKTKEILKATVRGLAERRGPEAVALAESAIESARAASAEEALQAGMADFIADDLDHLLTSLDGFTVQLASGPVTLHTRGATVTELTPSLIEQLLGALTNPNIVFILLALGVQAILIELSSPGGWVAGFVGVSALALGAYGLGILPVNWFGLVFLGTSFVLFVLDIKAPTHGALTAAGLASFIVGALVLFNSPGTPSFQRVSVPLVLGVGAVMAGAFLAVVSFVVRAHRRPVGTGSQAIVGRVGVVREALEPVGQVQVAGELWSAEVEDGAAAIPAGSRVIVEAVVGVRLRVRPADRPGG